MVQVLPYVPGFGTRLADAIAEGAAGFGKGYLQQLENQRVQNVIGSLSDTNKSPLQKFQALASLPPEQAKAILPAFATLAAPEQQALADIQQAKMMGVLPQDQNGATATMPGTPSPSDQPLGGAQPVIPAKALTPSEERKQKREEINQNLKFKGNKNPYLSGVASIAEQEIRDIDRQEDIAREMNKETLPAREEYSKKGSSARQGIQNKEKLLDLIRTGNIDDPSYAILAESLPLNLGKRLLSPETVEYKAGLVEEFGDLRNIFQGQTRVKEIELLEQKIADLYLTDDQKEAVLRSRIDALKADLIREDVASEIEAEGKPYGILQFRKEVEKRAEPKINALFNKILDDQTAIINSAANRKKIPLDPNDAEDRKISDQIFQEAGRDVEKARKLAKKKGYSL